MIFFLQAEDGIRDIGVTGVQTCALPIYKEGRYILEPKYNKICPMEDDNILINHNSKWGLMDANKNIIIKYNYDDILPVNNNFIVKINNKCGIIDRNENYIVP